MLPSLQTCVPQHYLSRFAGRLANSKSYWLKNYLISYFIKRYPVKMEEAIISDPFAYPSYNEFFTRALKPESRPISEGLYDFVSPADGIVSALGPLENGTLLQAKHHTYTVKSLIGSNNSLSQTFENGHFFTIYLAPHHYHRVHMPTDGHLEQMIYIPGKLFSVNQNTAENIPNLFSRNERVVCIFKTSQGKLAVILIGAMIVGSIETVWAGTVAPKVNREIKTINYDDAIFLRRGEEVGRFKMGSTVILLTESKDLHFELGLASGTELKFGQRIGQIN